MAYTKYQGSYVTYVKDQVPVGELKLERATIQRLVQEAVNLYSTDKPREITASVTGDGTYTYSMPASWVDGFSRIVVVEYPAGSQDPREDQIKADVAIVYDPATGTNKIRFRVHTPSSSETFRVLYTAPHSVTASATTIPDTDFEAVGALSTALVLRSLAARVLLQEDNHIRGDNLSIKPRSQLFIELGRVFLETYKKRLGLPDKGPIAAQTIFDLDPLPSWATQHLTHTRR